MEGLGDADELVDFAVHDPTVQLAGRRHAEDVTPADVLLVDVEEGFRADFRREAVGRRLRRQAEDEAVLVGLERESLQKAGAMDHRRLEEIVEASAVDEQDDGRVAVGEEVELVFLPVGAEALQGLLVGEEAALDRQVLRDDGAHALLDGGDDRGAVVALAPADGAEEPLPQRMAHAHLAVGTNLVRGLGEDEAERPAVDAPAVRVVKRQRGDRRRDHDGRRKRDDIVVEERGDDGLVVGRAGRHEEAERRSRVDLADGGVPRPIVKCDLDFAHGGHYPRFSRWASLLRTVPCPTV